MQITLDVPEQHLTDTDPEELAARIKLYAAVLMFSTGQLSAGAAAELAGVDRYAFVRECARHGIPMIDYPEEDLIDELERVWRTRFPPAPRRSTTRASSPAASSRPTARRPT